MHNVVYFYIYNIQDYSRSMNEGRHKRCVTIQLYLSIRSLESKGNIGKTRAIETIVKVCRFMKRRDQLMVAVLIFSKAY